MAATPSSSDLMRFIRLARGLCVLVLIRAFCVKRRPLLFDAASPEQRSLRRARRSLRL
jgi:hypothetical protein